VAVNHLKAHAVVLGCAAVALLFCLPVEAQSRISVAGDCKAAGAQAVHFDQTIYQADFKIMVSEFEAEPDIRIRLVKQPQLADLVLADDLPRNEVDYCLSSTRYQSTTLFVAKFVTQPDVVIMLGPNDRHADFTLYVDSETVSDDRAAALFWLSWQAKHP
jgi:hypothetical protein